MLNFQGLAIKQLNQSYGMDLLDKVYTYLENQTL
jgi:hypothetical protein